MMASVETSSQSIKFSEEFRQVVYKINPDYLSCTHKTLFEINATDNLRDQENDFQIHTNDSTERRKPCYDVNEMKYPSTSISNIAGTYSDSALKVLQSNYISTDRRELNGWEVCIRAHSAQSFSFRKHRLDSMRDLQRGRSLSASIKPTRREKVKVSKISVSSPGPLGSQFCRQDSVDSLCRRDDAHSSSSSSISGNNYCTPGYFTTNPRPIAYKFKHFEYTSNYIEQYRNEYTYRNLNPPSKPSSPSACNCEVRGHANPGRQPAYRWLDVPQDKDCSHPQQEGHAVTMSTSNGLTINSIKTPTQVEQAQVRSRQSPRYLLANSGVVKMGYYNSPLVIDTTKQGNKTPGLSRNRPTISSTGRVVLHPNSSSISPIRGSVFHRKPNK